MSNTPLTPAGWYPDPAGTANQRYWDGTAWTEHLAQPGLPAASTGIVQGDLAEGARVNTPFIWVFVLLAFVSPVQTLIELLNGDLASSVQVTTADRLHPFAMYSDPAYLAGVAFGLAIYAVSVVMGFLDARALKRAGIVRPFPWGWSFLSIVYIIGRTVVLRRRGHPNALPMWAYIVAIVFSLVLSVIAIVVGLDAVLPSLTSGDLTPNV